MMSETGNVFMRGENERDEANDSTSTCGEIENLPDEKQQPDQANNNPSPTETRTAICANPEMAEIAKKVESLKNWTMSRFKTTKQSVFEQLGKVERTIDTDMDTRIKALHDLHNRYRDVYNAARVFAANYSQMREAQLKLAESFYQLSLREHDLKETLNGHSETLRSTCHHGEAFTKQFAFFVSSLETLCMRTIKDMLQTVEIYEHARLEYDAHRHELAVLQQNADASRKAIEELQAKCETLKQRYESLKEDVRVKLALLDENRLKVMKAQLAQFEKGLHQSFAESIKSLHQSSPTAQDDGDEGNFVRGVAHGPSSFLEH